MSSLVRPLFDDPLDIVGDVHGEFDALDDLRRRLGYDTAGRHPDGRHLVFVGDLCDRGPRSLSTMRWVRRLVTDGHAQWVIGNHELALVTGQHKHGNAWFFDTGLEKDREYAPFESLTDASERADLQAFLDTLPLALERPDLRVVHAAWHATSIAACRAAPGPVSSLYARYTKACESLEPGR
ncbi:MAG: metallophosphoesterase, partial [Steroidobacteraceae bacterium]